MSEHTPEPWSFEQDMRGDGVPDDCYTIFGDPETECIARVFTKEDARRIVACVNALACVPTETLEQECTAAASLKVRAEEAERLLRDGEWVVRNILSGLSTDPNQDQDETWAHAKHRARLFLDAARAFLDRRPK